MITKELVDFIKREKSAGHSSEQIKSVLVQNGWLSSDVEEGFRTIDTPPVSAPSPAAPPPPTPMAETMSRRGHGGKRAMLFMILFLLTSRQRLGLLFPRGFKKFASRSQPFPKHSRIS